MAWLENIKAALGGSKIPQVEILDLVPNGGAFSSEHEQIRNLLRERFSRENELSMSYEKPDLKRFEAFGPFNSTDRDQQARYVTCLVTWLLQLDRIAHAFKTKPRGAYNPQLQETWERSTSARVLLAEVFNTLLKRKPPLTADTCREMLEWTVEVLNAGFTSVWQFPIAQMVSTLEEQAKTADVAGVCGTSLDQLLKILRSGSDNDLRKLADRAESLLGRSPELPIVAGEVWANAAIIDLEGLDRENRVAWIELLRFCKTAGGGSPNTKWLMEARILIARLDPAQVSRLVCGWFALCEKKKPQPPAAVRAWILRCAEEKFEARRYELYQLLPADKRSSKELEVFDKAIREADDPWAYLRDFQNQPEAMDLFGTVAPEFHLPPAPPAQVILEDLLIIQPHMDLLVGLAWCCGLQRDASVTRALGLLAVSMYRKVPGIGPRAVRVGNACIVALGMIGDADALGQLALLKVKVKFGGAQAAIDKAMTKLADKLGISREDLEEMSVPAYGLTGVGRMDLTIGDCTAELSVIDSRSTALAWMRSDGKVQKSMPASLKQEHPEEVKELLAAKKDIERMLPAQAERLDALYLRRKCWPLDIWRERYLDHPLVGSLARRLIWNFTTDGMTIPGVWLKDALVDPHGQPLALDQMQTTVTLWHPLHQEPGMVLGWRGFLEEWEIIQPFKQAHREIYLLTPPEETTRTYSNRFAAHILKQHQFNALCAARGWKNKLRLMVDDEYPPATRRLPQWELRAEFWIEGAGAEYGTDTLDSGAYRYVTTDQVRFYQENDPQVSAHAGGGGYGQRQVIEPTPLASVDPLVFSEIMRDVDLFVGVASVGNDPNWLDGGHTDQQRQYWGEVSFGELGASAQTRKSLLERLIPKLKIAGACSFEERFLVVQGKRHAYKIHLGSGNILIKPQDKYLCIVPAQRQVDKDGGKLFLPFEGDRTLSVIISKAFLLAADDKITDATILRQLA